MDSRLLRVCGRGKGLNTGAEFCVCRVASYKVLVKSERLILAGKFDGNVKRSA